VNDIDACGVARKVLVQEESMHVDMKRIHGNERNSDDPNPSVYLSSWPGESPSGQNRYFVSAPR
jgi:hypothetical protein